MWDHDINLPCEAQFALLRQILGASGIFNELVHFVAGAMFSYHSPSSPMDSQG